LKRRLSSPKRVRLPVSDIIQKGMISAHPSTGYLRCRFENGTENLRNLGRHISSLKTVAFSPFFAITNGVDEPIRKVPLSKNVVLDMTDLATFEVCKISISLSNPQEQTTIALSLKPRGEEKPIPISGFPRKLAQEDKLSCKCPFPLCRQFLIAASVLLHLSAQVKNSQYAFNLQYPVSRQKSQRDARHQFEANKHFRHYRNTSEAPPRAHNFVNLVRSGTSTFGASSSTWQPQVHHDAPEMASDASGLSSDHWQAWVADRGWDTQERRLSGGVARPIQTGPTLPGSPYPTRLEMEDTSQQE
jgi:hypothetical protein